MNFFENQRRAHRNTRRLLVLMTLAVVAVVMCVTAAVAFFGWSYATPARALPFGSWAMQNTQLLGVIAGATVLFIGAASLYRIYTLKSGGDFVARRMGGIAVGRDAEDPLHRRLRNVVEEMAIAASLPVPAVFVLEGEPGINAFAAGFSPDDAAVAVTRGALEQLSRDELQGVVAHEFSHILNGDMRLNIQLMGPLFGILSVALIGRTLLRGGNGRKGSRVAALLGAGLLATGYIGLVFGRIIKAGISRQREYLADASAVQFTRQTTGIANALKKISARDAGSYIREEDSEEISHMLFAAGFSSLSDLLATHPPLFRRIKALDPGFDEQAFRERGTLDANLNQVTSKDHAARSIFFDTVTLTTPALAEAAFNSIGKPNDEHVEAAHEFLEHLPAAIRHALGSPADVLLILPALLLSHEPSARVSQMQFLRQQLGEPRVRQISELHALIAQMDPSARLPLLELALPALRETPSARLEFTVTLLEQIALNDNRLEIFEYALLRIVESYLRGAQRPGVQRWRNLSHARMQAAAIVLLQIMAHHSHAGPDAAEKAFARGMKIIGSAATGYRPPGGDWVRGADKAVATLSRCTPHGREAVIRALTVTALSDNQVSTRETELLRAFCMMLDCPMPPILDAESAIRVA